MFHDRIPLYNPSYEYYPDWVESCNYILQYDLGIVSRKPHFLSAAQESVECLEFEKDSE